MATGREHQLIAIGTATGFAELFQAVTDAFTTLIGADRGVFWGYSELLQVKDAPRFLRRRVLCTTDTTYASEQRAADMWMSGYLDEFDGERQPVISEDDNLLEDAANAGLTSVVVQPFTVKLPLSLRQLMERAASHDGATLDLGDRLTLGILFLTSDAPRRRLGPTVDGEYHDLLTFAQRQVSLHWRKYQNQFQTIEFEKSAYRFDVLLKTSQAIVGGVVLNDFMPYLLDQVILATKAERGFIILLDGEGNRTIPSARRKNGYDLPSEEWNISWSTLDECFESGKPVYVVNAQDDTNYSGKSSIINLSLQTILCTPLYVKGEAIGAVYLDSGYVSDSLAQDDLRLLEGIAGTAAMAINDNRLLLDRIEREFVHRENESLRHLDQRKTELLRTVAHELRNPLSIMVGYAELLKRKGTEDPKLVASSLERILTNGRRITAMLEGLLDISRLKSGLYKVAKKPVVVGDVVDNIIENVKVLAGEKDITLRRETPPNVMVLSDPDLLSQVFLNLLTNAVKFSPPGGEVTCRVTLEQLSSSDDVDKQVARISVVDKGYGIPESELERIFEVFHRVENEATNYTEGTGLGLAITKTIIEVLGGSITVQSKVGRGSTFSFELPAL